MQIGLIRHFKVKHPFPRKFFVPYEELVQWFVRYELADIEKKDVDLRGISWGKCYSSPTERALKTAEYIYNGEIIKLDELKELDILPAINKKYKLPFIIWGILIRNKALSSHNLTNEFASKISNFVDQLLAEDSKNVLIFSHGFVMMFLQKEIIKRGFKGDNFMSPVNGKVYLFESK